MPSPLADAFAVNARKTLDLLAAVADETLAASISAKVRTAGELFAHIHNVRLLRLEVSTPDLCKGMSKFAAKVTPTRKELNEALAASGTAMTELFRRADETGKVKSFKPHPAVFLGYAIAHEAHHRGQIGWTCKLTGHPLEKSVANGLWEWAK